MFIAFIFPQHQTTPTALQPIGNKHFYKQVTPTALFKKHKRISSSPLL